MALVDAIKCVSDTLERITLSYNSWIVVLRPSYTVDNKAKTYYLWGIEDINQD